MNFVRKMYVGTRIPSVEPHGLARGFSQWSVIDNPNDFEDITKETLDNVWYVQLLKEFYGDKENEKEGKEKCNPQEKI